MQKSLAHYQSAPVHTTYALCADLEKAIASSFDSNLKKTAETLCQLFTSFEQLMRISSVALKEKRQIRSIMSLERDAISYYIIALKHFFKEYEAVHGNVSEKVHTSLEAALQRLSLIDETLEKVKMKPLPASDVHEVPDADLQEITKHFSIAAPFTWEAGEELGHRLLWRHKRSPNDAALICKELETNVALPLMMIIRIIESRLGELFQKREESSLKAEFEYYQSIYITIERRLAKLRHAIMSCPFESLVPHAFRYARALAHELDEAKRLLNCFAKFGLGK
jgi:hypothetical protein